jgi:hypothetical protein
VLLLQCVVIILKMMFILNNQRHQLLKPSKDLLMIRIKAINHEFIKPIHDLQLELSYEMAKDHLINLK